MLHQQLQQKMLQKLSPQQIQLMKLIQIPAIAIEERIKQEIDENPALETDENEDVSDESAEDKTTDISEEPEDEINDVEFDIDEYFSDDDVPDYKIYSSEGNTEQKAIPFASEMSFQDVLYQQLSMRNLTEKQEIIGRHIIGNIDDSGYLQRETINLADDLTFLNNIIVEHDEIEEVIKIIQEFDPRGVGARNLQECLLIQLESMQYSVDTKNATEIIKNLFKEFTKKHYGKILKKMSVTEEELKGAIGIIVKLNPKPGNSSQESSLSKNNQYIVPDFIITIDNDELSLSLNSFNIPDLRLSRSYIESLSAMSKKSKMTENEKQTVKFLKQKIDSAKWFIDAIKQRHNTLYSTMYAIMSLQKEFFLIGDETMLKPMILKNIAEIVRLDISTISRVASSKYVQTPYGTYLLKYFFSETITTDAGENASSREVKKILSDCIDKENKKKSLTDEQLCKILNEKGYQIARRTIAKYREMLNIPVARLRKEL